MFCDVAVSIAANLDGVAKFCPSTLLPSLFHFFEKTFCSFILFLEIFCEISAKLVFFVLCFLVRCGG